MTGQQEDARTSEWDRLTAIFAHAEAAGDCAEMARVKAGHGTVIGGVSAAEAWQRAADAHLAAAQAYALLRT